MDLAEKNGGRFEGLLKGNLFVSDNVKVHVLRQYLKKRWVRAEQGVIFGEEEARDFTDRREEEVSGEEVG